MRRQRAGIACDKCRALKAKCDGRQPVCARCEGYGFQCRWHVRRRGESRDRSNDLHGQETKDNSSQQVLDLKTTCHRTAQSYEALIQELRADLDSSRQASLDACLSGIRGQVPGSMVDDYRPAPSNAVTAPHACTVIESPTYVGKVSDIHFIHTVRQCIQGRDLLDREEPASQTYGQTRISDSLAALSHPLFMPSREEATHFLEIYLSTIHIAYPFLCKQTILEEFECLWTEDRLKPEHRPSLALFSFIFAIGSYYTSFPHGKSAGIHRHFEYFEQGRAFCHELSANCSLSNIWALLVQCFFLLAVCHTDQCWNVLGLAIRMGQSIGLHVESSRREPKWIMDCENRRRTWYSMYVLDRLLALQLGRPMAIHETDFKVELPSQHDQSAFGVRTEGVPVEDKISPPHGLMMDYFVQVIRFSRIVGLVICELYRPSQVDLSPDQMLNNASLLDQRLFQWKADLPRHLRFDLGHTFEKSISFKRQRNMLAVKCHHLRALIYRSFLCLPVLQVNNKPFMDLLLQDKQRISKAEWICISEAQQTAHLLHHVVDERSLVHDFPWWQMISCLICASSILFVAETFHGDKDLVEGHSLEGRASAQSLREDAETCLKVFEALSVNSAPARKAANMLGGLSQVRLLANRSPEAMPSPPAARPQPSSALCESHANILDCPQIHPQTGLSSASEVFHSIGPVRYQVLWNGPLVSWTIPTLNLSAASTLKMTCYSHAGYVILLE